jgi:glycosyltransferase involved in cell wall biosynthesis
MRILILTFYYPPDISAGAFRMKGFVPALVERLPSGSRIDVLTTVPNRYRSFARGASALERNGAVTVQRIPIPPHKSGMLDQSRSFSVFARQVRAIAARNRYDLVFATSSRLMTAVLGSVVARRQRAPLYLDIRDIFAENMGELLPASIAWGSSAVLDGMERFAVTRAARVNLVSEGFLDYFQGRYPQCSYGCITNGIDDEFIEADWDAAVERDWDPLRTITYAGNMGEGQGLHLVVPALAKALQGQARFRMIGDGGKRTALERAVKEMGVKNVEVLAPMSREDLLREYRNTDVLFLHLNDYAAFRRVLPSKIFEYAATGRPIWAGVAGHAADFLGKHVKDALIFPPGDATAAVDAWRRLNFGVRARPNFIETFSRQSTSAALAEDVAGLLEDATTEA